MGELKDQAAKIVWVHMCMARKGHRIIPSYEALLAERTQCTLATIPFAEVSVGAEEMVSRMWIPGHF